MFYFCIFNLTSHWNSALFIFNGGFICVEKRRVLQNNPPFQWNPFQFLSAQTERREWKQIFHLSKVIQWKNQKQLPMFALICVKFYFNPILKRHFTVWNVLFNFQEMSRTINDGRFFDSLHHSAANVRWHLFQEQKKTLSKYDSCALSKLQPGNRTSFVPRRSNDCYIYSGSTCWFLPRQSDVTGKSQWFLITDAAEDVEVN